MARASAENRGRVETIKLTKAIVFNGHSITHAVIEIDHINHGLNDNTGLLNKKARTNFTVKDIEKFILLLNGEEIAPRKRRGSRSKFTLKIECPIVRHHHGKTFIMIFEHDYHNAKELYTLTLYPGW